ncbi:MAG: hypothetical protein QMD82_06415 [bacterium]|nr:hypothetical protein [bacterium]
MVKVKGEDRAGTQVIITKEGILLIYHAVGEISQEIGSLYGLSNCIERAYSVNLAILGPENPYRILARTKYPLYVPLKSCELYGSEKYPIDVPVVVFLTGAIFIENKLLDHAVAGDKYIVLFSADINKLIEYMFRQNIR